MYWKEEAALKLKRKNKILFGKDSECLRDLICLLSRQSHAVAVLWALEFADRSVTELENKYAGEKRPREALDAARSWAAGNIGMRFAQRKILDCHALAKEIESKEDIAVCHAVGQACSTVHTAGHAIGFPIYDLTAVIYKYGLENSTAAVERRLNEYEERLIFYEKHIKDYKGQWAAFILR